VVKASYARTMVRAWALVIVGGAAALLISSPVLKLIPQTVALVGCWIGVKASLEEMIRNTK